MRTNPPPPPAQGPPAHRPLEVRWLVGTAIYAALASGLAAAGFTRSTVLVLGAVALTFPCGLGGLVGFYLVYGLTVTLDRSFGAQVPTGAGRGPLWFVILGETLICVMFAIVAVANSFLLRDALHQRRIKRHRRSVTHR